MGKPTLDRVTELETVPGPDRLEDGIPTLKNQILANQKYFCGDLDDLQACLTRPNPRA